MPCEVCNIVLTEEQKETNEDGSEINPPVRFEAIKGSAKNGCEWCELIVSAIDHFFTTSQPITHTKVWKVSRAWNEAPGAISLIHKASEPGLIKDEWDGTVYLSCGPGQPPQSFGIPVRNHTCNDTASPAAVRIAKAWLDECSANHSECTRFRNTSMPRRTVFVGLNNDQVMLSENEGASKQYACLSHCWGKIQPLRTTNQTIEAHQDRIPWNHLPKTFQDAVEFCRAVGVEHIWIDSLCIVQDDEEDWAAESAKMALIYSGASFTIAAMASEDGRGGCFRRDERKVFEFPLKNGEVNETKILVTVGNHEGRTPLRDRAWVFQEMLLSRRIIYFNEFELAWECRTETKCECCTDRPKPKAKQFYQTPWKDRAWEELVCNYTKKHISNGMDKLPALSGIAYNFKSLFREPQGEYYAGMWQRGLLGQLCWTVSPLDGCDTKLSYYRAPTWSWASVNGKIEFVGLSVVNMAPSMYAAETIGGHCIPSTVDPYGQVSGGYVDVKTLLLPVSLPQWDIDLLLEAEGNSPSTIHLKSVHLDSGDDAHSSQISKELFCAVLRFGLEQVVHNELAVWLLTVLLLERSAEHEASYRRVGLATVELSFGEWPKWLRLKALIRDESQTVRIL